MADFLQVIKQKTERSIQTVMEGGENNELIWSLAANLSKKEPFQS
jgi:hypothetical protein